MELTITQNGALYAIQHRASNEQSNGQTKRARAREKVPPPRLGVNTVSAHKLETEELCFISSGT